MTELRFTPEASADLINIYEFSIFRFGIEAADTYHSALEATCARLTDFPKLGTFYPNISPPMRYLTCRNHHIFYVIEDGAVLIARILHHAMNAAPHLRQ